MCTGIIWVMYASIRTGEKIKCMSEREKDLRNLLIDENAAQGGGESVFTLPSLIKVRA